MKNQPKNRLSDEKAVDAFLKKIDNVDELSLLGRKDIVDLVCQNCDFWSPDKKKLECAALKILALLILEGVITKETLLKLKR